jgi:hypothetical protein
MKGILFKTEMVQANAAGRKNQTRRVIKPQPPNDGQPWQIGQMIESTAREDKKHEGKLHWLVMENEYSIKDYDSNYFTCPYGQTGDILFTRETFQETELFGKPVFIYKADIDVCDQCPVQYGDTIYCLTPEEHWTPAIHMPTDAARYFHRIVSIRAERIMDISAEDCINEGIESWTEERLKSKPTRYKLYGLDPGEESDPPLYCSNPITSYRSLWQAINGKPKPIQHKQNGKLITTGYIVYPWGDYLSRQPYAGLTEWRGKPLTVVPNPWVWRIEYENIGKNEAMIRAKQAQS